MDFYGEARKIYSKKESGSGLGISDGIVGCSMVTMGIMVIIILMIFTL